MKLNREDIKKEALTIDSIHFLYDVDDSGLKLQRKDYSDEEWIKLYEIYRIELTFFESFGGHDDNGPKTLNFRRAGNQCTYSEVKVADKEIIFK